MRRLAFVFTLLAVAVVTTAALVRPGVQGWTPAIDPTLVLWYDFAGGETLTPRRGPPIAFTRATTRTCWDADGTLVTLAANTPCFDHDPSDNTSLGLLVEEAFTEVALQTEDLTTTWTNPGANTTITANASAAPDGNTTADDVLHGDSAETIKQAITATDNTVYVISAFVAQGTTGAHDWVKIAWLDDSAGANGFEAWFDLTDCSAGTAQADGTGSYTAGSARTQDFGTFCRISAAGQIPSGQTDARFEIINTTADAVDTAEAVNSVFWWGLNAGTGTFALSYVSATTSQVTRATDLADVTNVTFVASAVGTLYAEGRRIAGNTSFAGVVSLSDDSSTNEVYITDQGDDAQAYSRKSGGANGDTAYSDNSWTLGTSSKAAVAYATNDMALIEGGQVAQTDTSVDPPTVITLFRLGGRGGAADKWNGHIAEARYYSVRKPNSFLTNITTAANDNAPVMFAEAIGW